MTPLGPLDVAETAVLQEARRLLEAMRKHVANDPQTVSEAIAVLRSLRAEVYEDLNQLQHQYLIIRSATWLQRNSLVPAHASWLWNPRQTGDKSEPDLTALVNGLPIASAEITASAKPEGAIDKRMKTTLEKLSQFPGAKYYFVCTDEMYQRATTKVRTGKRDIQVVSLAEV